MRALVRTAVVAVVVLAACGSNGDPAPDIVLDGSPRRPDDQGLVTAISEESITLDGTRTYRVSRKLKAFSTVTLELEPMLSREGQYVLIGTSGKTMVWMAGVAQVVSSGDRRSVFYTGTLEAVEGDELVFRDGTVLRLAPGREPGASSGPVLVEIDVDERRVIEVTPA